MSIEPESNPPAAAQRPTPRTDSWQRNWDDTREVLSAVEEMQKMERELAEAREKLALAEEKLGMWKLSSVCREKQATIDAQAEQIERQRALLAKIRHPLFSMTRGELCAAINAVLSDGAPAVREEEGSK